MVSGNVLNSLTHADDPNLKTPYPLFLEQGENPPPPLFGEALASIESKDMMFFIDTENIGVEILFLYSVALISNIGLLTSEGLTIEPNDEYTTFN